MENIGEKIFVEHRGETTVITFMNEKIIDQAYIQELQESIMVVIEQSREKLILDFCNVTFMSSAALGFLIKIHKRVCERHGKLELYHIDPKIYEVFKIMKLTKLFKIRS